MAPPQPGKLLSQRAHDIGNATPFLKQTGPFLHRRIFGAKGQYALQIGASLGLLLIFVAVPFLRSNVKEWNKRFYDDSNSRMLIHERVVATRMKWREQLAAEEANDKAKK
jgi:hypothetical protein